MPITNVRHEYSNNIFCFNVISYKISSNVPQTVNCNKYYVMDIYVIQTLVHLQTDNHWCEIFLMVSDNGSTIEYKVYAVLIYNCF